MTRFEQFLEEYITESINDKGILKSAFFAGTPGCFDGDTLVNTLKGYKKISEIQHGENVLTFNENTLKDEWNEVETTYEYDINKGIMELEFDNGEKVICTEDHEFYVNGEWIKAKDLTVMKLKNKKVITNVYNKDKVYDLKIKNNHNYYITKSNILVHNSGKSFVRKKIKSGTIEPRVVNTDKFSEFFDEKGVNWELYGDKMKSLTKNQLVQYLNSLLPLWIDGTSSNPSSVFRRQGILKSIGYDTAMIWIETSLETALERNRQRERQVPEDFIKKIYDKIAPLKDYYKSEFNNFKVINNDKGALTEDVIVDAYKQMESFFLSDLENPIGQKLIEEMKENGYKYLIDTDEYTINDIKKLVDNWYKK